jgi:D-sedoheptulose 7-phosphate isomerase
MDKDFLLNQLCDRHPLLGKVKKSIGEAAGMIIDCYSKGGKLLVCGNGGSSSDSDHIVGEMMKSFECERPLVTNLKMRLAEITGTRGKYLAQKLEGGFPAISLSVHTALTTAICNDIDANLVFAQQIIGYGRENDVLIGISTSGNSQNVIDACITAKALNINIIGVTGKTGGKMKQYCDILVAVPEKQTAFVQELQLPLLHTLCLIVENHFYGHHNY